MKRLSIPILLVSAFVGCSSNASFPVRPSSATPSIVPGLSRVSSLGGSLPTTSPDGTTIAFLRDPRDPFYSGPGDPFVLQVWLIHPDGSGLRRLGQQPRCCIGAVPDLEWSPDGSSIVLTGTHRQRLDVATGETWPLPSQTG
jgi:Tol biopolymer transport system component